PPPPVQFRRAVAALRHVAQEAMVRLDRELLAEIRVHHLAYVLAVHGHDPDLRSADGPRPLRAVDDSGACRASSRRRSPRPRLRRDITVPIGTPSASAASRYVSPSTYREAAEALGV